MTTLAVENLLITAELTRRPARPALYAAENQALVTLAECMTQNPQHLPQQLTELALALCNAGSAGISLLQQDPDGEFFHWIALSGGFAPYAGGRTPRHFSPCGLTLDANVAQLFYCPASVFTYFNDVDLPIVEALVVPFYLNGDAAGTIWIVGHDARQQFDTEDLRLMTSLARFTGAALHMIRSLGATQTANQMLALEIQEHTQTEAALRESETRFHTMADNAPVMIWMINAASDCIYLNQHWYAFTGQTAPTGLGRGWLAMIHPDDAPAMRQAFWAAHQQRQPFRLDYRLRGTDGIYRWVINSATPRFGLDGEYLGYIGSVLDITERKQTEERLQTIYQLSETVNHAEELEQIYAAVLRALSRLLQVDRAAILLFDAAGVMRFQAWHNLSAAYRAQAEGHSPWQADEQDPQPLLLPDAAQAALGSLQTIILDEGICALAFIPLVEQGRLLGKFMLYYDQPHAFLDAEVQLALTLARHVAHAIQRKQAEQALHQLNQTLEQRVRERTAELERRNQELDQFTYVASHDLKAPLRGIHHLTNWISDDAAAVLPAASQAHLAKLHGRIQRMEKLLDDLLLYSRAGRLYHPPEHVDTAQLVRNTIELLAPPAGFCVCADASLPLLLAERIPLEMIFRNLIDNAIKHHERPHDGHVVIKATEQDQWLTFSVTDDGPGIAPEFHGRIFQLFQTLKPRDVVEGSGMGLAVVKKLVEYRGGRIEVESSLGQGATFRFTWPKAPSSALATA